MFRRGMPVDAVTALAMNPLSQSAMPYASRETIAAVSPYDLRTTHLTARSSSIERAADPGTPDRRW